MYLTEQHFFFRIQILFGFKSRPRLYEFIETPKFQRYVWL